MRQALKKGYKVTKFQSNPSGDKIITFRSEKGKALKTVTVEEKLYPVALHIKTQLKNFGIPEL